MKKIIFLSAFLISVLTLSAQLTTPNDGMWIKQSVALSNTPEAEFMVRTGDIDNLGFSFPEGFNPFCGRYTDAHFYPWDENPRDAPGTDRMLIPSSYTPGTNPCGADGYSDNYGKPESKPAPIILPLGSIKGVVIRDAYLQLFIDDFQAPELCSKFQMTLNGKRFVEAEKLLNRVNQTGPVGKLITLAIPEEFYPELQKEQLSVFIDDPTSHAADGYAIDFVKLLINRNSTAICKGIVTGYVMDAESQAPLAGANVHSAENIAVKSGEDGSFRLEGIPAGLEIITASAPGYADGSGIGDVASDGDGEPVMIYLTKSNKKASYNGRNISEGESIVMNNILFDQGSASLKTESLAELDKIVRFMQENPTGEIELSGHTSSEGDRSLNKSLSYKRVSACKNYIVSKGIDTGRIIAVGFGPDRPVASNNTEAGRGQNRRVEMRVLRL